MVKTTKSERAFCDSKKLAAVVGVSLPTPANWFRAGKIPGVVIGATVRFPIAEVAKILNIDPELLK
jgi:excisionase family DNA binding protein